MASRWATIDDRENRNSGMARNGKNAFTWLKSHVAYGGDDCLIWPFTRIRQKGYGMLGYGGKKGIYAHRTMCELAHGKPPTKKSQARHSCGKGHLGCVNPRHLSWSTNSQNQKDRRRHGTHGGSIGARTRLTLRQIANIRARRGIETQASIARRLGVSVGCVEYWQRHNRPPASPGTSPEAIRRRQQKSAGRTR
jgi:DNA-binding transcriptional regulator YiaG